MVEPVLEPVEPVLEVVKPVLEVVEPALEVGEPALEAVESLLKHPDVRLRGGLVGAVGRKVGHERVGVRLPDGAFEGSVEGVAGGGCGRVAHGGIVAKEWIGRKTVVGVAWRSNSYGGLMDDGRRSTTWLLLAGGMALFGSATPVSRLVGRELPSLVASGLRMAVAAVVLVPVLVWWERRSSRGFVERLRGTSVADRWALAGIAVIGTFGFSALLVLGMRLVPGATGAVVMALTPAVTAAGAVLFLGDRLDGRLAAALVLGVAGVVVVNLGAPPEGGGGNAVLGTMLVFGAVCAEATYTLLGKRLSADFDMIEISTMAAVGGLAAFAVPGLFQLGDVQWSSLSPATWWGVLWWGMGTMALGSVAWFAGVRRVRGIVASVFMTVMPVSALVLSYVLLGESFSLWHLVGMTAVVAGILLVATREGVRRGRAT